MRGMFVFLLECIWHWIDDWEENGHFKFWWGFPGHQPNPRPHVRTPSAWVDLLLRWVRPNHHVALGCPCPERELARAPPVGTLGVGAACPCASSDPSARWRWFPLPWVGAKPPPPHGVTWRLDCLPFCWVKPTRHVMLGLACPVPRAKGQTRCGVGAANNNIF